jgi:hypothetical protein
LMPILIAQYMQNKGVIKKGVIAQEWGRLGTWIDFRGCRTDLTVLLYIIRSESQSATFNIMRQ